MQTTIPFEGFYNSRHDAELDYALDSAIDNSRGDVIEALKDKAFNAMNWQKAHIKYARLYSEFFREKLGIGSLEFFKLDSPKFYNFETDRIFCNISFDDVEMMFNKIDLDLLEKHIKERFTSYDGFISFYPNSLAKWPCPLEQWDINHVGTLLEVYVKQFAEEIQNEWYEDLHETTYQLVTSVLGENPEGERIMNIAHYLRTREERAFR